MALLGNERIAIALLAVDLHQLQAQITALRLLLDALFQQGCSLIQTAGADVRLGFVQHVVRAVGGWRHQWRGDGWRDHNRGRSGRRSRCGGQFYARRGNLQAFETAFRQVKIGRKRLLLCQGAGHAQVFLGFLLGFATTGQQQQQQHHNQGPATGQAQQPRISQ